MRKRILSMLLALAMVMALLPMTALAADVGDITGSFVYFRGVQVNLTQGSTNIGKPGLLLIRKGLNKDKWGTINIPYAARVAGYSRDDGTAPIQYALGGSGTGEVESWILDEAVVEDWLGYSNDELNDVLDRTDVTPNLNEHEVEEGQFLIVRCNDLAANDIRIYIAKIDVDDPQDDTEVIASAMIKGKSTGQLWRLACNHYENYSDATSYPTKVNLKTVGSETIKYEDAVGNGKNVVSLTAGSTKNSSLEVRMAEGKALSDGSDQDVENAFNEGVALTETSALSVGPEGGKVWIIAKVTSESGKHIDYYVLLVNVEPAPHALKVTKIVLNQKQNQNLVDFGKEIEFKGDDLVGGDTPENPAVLTATIPSKDKDGNVINVDIRDLDVTLTLDNSIGNTITISDGGHPAASPAQTTFYGMYKDTTSSTTYTLANRDFSKGYALYLKVTVPVVKEDGTPANSPIKYVDKYYKLVVAKDAISDDASIHSGSVIGNWRIASVTGKITGELDKVGTGRDFAELTAVVPYIEPEKWDAYSNSTIRLTVDLGAEVKYIVTKSRYDDLDDRDFVDFATPIKDNVKKGVSEFEINNGYDMDGDLIGFDAQKQRVYIQVIAPDGVTNSIYVLDNITMAEKGSEARLTDVVITQNSKELEKGTYAVQFGEESGESDDPITVTATIPYGSTDENLAAKLTASYGATIYNQGVGNEKIDTKNLKIGEPTQICVMSGDLAETTYYVLTIKIADLADKNADDSIVLDPQNGTLTVDPGTTVADVKNGLVYGGALQVLGADDQTAADTDKVATGYVAKVGTTELDIIVRGDVNKDGACGLADALLALKSTRGSVTLDVVQKAAADVDGNADVTLADALKILKSVRA